MWSMANPALIVIFSCSAPIYSDYNFAIEGQEELYNEANKSFQKASNLVGSYMGITDCLQCCLHFFWYFILQKKN